MNALPVVIALTIVNVALVAVPHTFAAGETTPVIRGRALEIVDERGRVRASITVHAAGTHDATGAKYPETVVLRLIDANGRPEVKIAASEHGGGLSFVGDSDATQVLLHAQRSQSTLTLANGDGVQRRIRP